MGMGANQGKVYLVGAGPGDPKLITIRGLEALRRSDAVVYDRLASPRLLKEMKPDAEKIYVGKLPDRHTMKQEEINQLLVDLALQGKTVTRLKGGDPSVFGRVGEEAELLVEHGVEFEIVPGITSASAVPAYAGIPITHRDFASSVAIVTGHENPEKLDMNIQWDKLTPATDTLIFLMGVAKIAYIAKQLIDNGKPPDTPVALIRWGTRINQRTIVGTLADIADKVEQANFKPPAVIIVGKVVTLRDRLNWYEKKPLFGSRVLVTRSRGQASELAERIDALGGEPYEFPVISIRRPRSAGTLARLDEALGRLEQYDWVLFTSVNGVDYFFKRLGELRIDVRRLHRARIAAVGPGTEAALAARGLMAEPLPDIYQAEGLLEAIRGELRPGQRVLLPRGDLARSYLPEELERLGLLATEAHVYENTTFGEAAGEDTAEVIDMLERGDIHYVTFTSSSTVTNLCAVLQAASQQTAPAELLRRAGIVCIGPKTLETARQWGLAHAVMAQEATIASLVDALTDLSLHRQA